jgi:CheY-like chemotaxis protein
MNPRTLLLVDDDADLREMLVEQLSLYEEFVVLEEESATKGIQAARGGVIDLLIIDVGLPDMDGREAVKILRKSGFKAPVIMLTGHDTDSDTILGLEAGANDYVTKPFKFAVLLARIRAQLRQHEQSEDATFVVGPYTFKPSQKLLIDGSGSKIRLTEKGSRDHQVSLPRRPQGGYPGHAAGGGLGLQFRRHDPHARDPCLPAAPEDREGSVQRPDPRHGERRLQAQSLIAARL